MVIAIPEREIVPILENLDGVTSEILLKFWPRFVLEIETILAMHWLSFAIVRLFAYIRNRQIS